MLMPNNSTFMPKTFALWLGKHSLASHIEQPVTSNVQQVAENEDDTSVEPAGCIGTAGLAASACCRPPQPNKSIRYVI